MDAITLLREQFKGTHQWLEGTMQDVTPQQAHYAPQGKAIPIGAGYAHIALAEDWFINGLLKGGTPLVASTWAGKTGLSEPPPPPEQGDWSQWARRVRVDMPALRKYAEAVYAATDQYIGSLNPRSLNRTVALPMPGMEKTPVGVVLSILLGHANNHCGEVSALKGIQGARGYPL
jgi:hypothetical protein